MGHYFLYAGNIAENHDQGDAHQTLLRIYYIQQKAYRKKRFWFCNNGRVLNGSISLYIIYRIYTLILKYWKKLKGLLLSHPWHHTLDKCNEAVNYQQERQMNKQHVRIMSNGEAEQLIYELKGTWPELASHRWIGWSRVVLANTQLAGSEIVN